MTQRNGPVDPAAVKQTLLDTLKPLEDHLETIEAAISEAEADLVQLRELRRLVARMIGVANPEHPKAPTKTGPKRGRGKIGHHQRELRENRKRALREWLTVATLPPEGAYATWVAEHAPAEAVGNGTYHARVQCGNRYLPELADEGFLRLDHIGGPSKRTKFYKPTMAAVS